ncbi:7-cyano-7-deazaguanine synthase QueC, partial [Candidatus Pacearchaeota archaeon]
MSKIIVIFSGGIDSTTVLYWSKKYFDEIYAITFDYGQKNKIEIDFAKIIAKKVGVKEHKIFKIDLSQIGGSALINKGIDIPKNRSIDEILGGGVAPTYVPLRNAIFITIASAWAETLGIQNIAIGVHRIDTSGYPDTTPQFIESIENMLNTGSKMAVEGKKLKIYTPLIDLDKAGIIK